MKTKNPNKLIKYSIAFAHLKSSNSDDIFTDNIFFEIHTLEVVCNVSLARLQTFLASTGDSACSLVIFLCMD